MVMLLGAMLILVSPVSASTTVTNDLCKPVPVSDAFDFIRIGDKDGFGFGEGKGSYQAANGGPINVDNQGLLSTGDFLPDLNKDGKISNRNQGDPFDNRTAELSGAYLEGNNYTDNSKNKRPGSDYTDLSLGKSFGKGDTAGRPFPGDGDPKNVPYKPEFKFRFLVEKGKILQGAPLFFNLVIGDYDVKPGEIMLHPASGNDRLIPLETSKGKGDGLITSAYAQLGFRDVFKDGDRPQNSGKDKEKYPGYWVGNVDVDVNVPDEPYIAFDYAEIYTTQIPTEPCPPIVYEGKIRGLKWDDVNGDGIRSTIISGNPPDVVFVIDTSGSTNYTFQGSNMGDRNNDGKYSTILDGEIAGFITLNQQLIDQGFGDTGKVGITRFNSGAGSLDMDLVQPGQQLYTTPAADKNNNGTPDVEEVLSSLVGGGGTNYQVALSSAITTLGGMQTPKGNANLVFISDGKPNTGTPSYYAEVAKLQNDQVNVTAFGAGNGAKLPPLQIIDPNAYIFTTTDDLINVFTGTGGTAGGSSTGGLEPVLPGVTIYLDLNNNGTLDTGEPSQKTNDKGLYEFTGLAPGIYTVREVVPSGFKQTAPGGGFATITLQENEVVNDVKFGNTK